jgi:hypothetical protein
MRVRLLWVAWGAAVVMAVVVLVAAFSANRATPAPAQVHHVPRALPIVAVTLGAAVAPRRHIPLPPIGVAEGPGTPVASGP